jgi:hypothetical protein
MRLWLKNGNSYTINLQNEDKKQPGSLFSVHPEIGKIGPASLIHRLWESGKLANFFFRLSSKLLIASIR